MPPLELHPHPDHSPRSHFVVEVSARRRLADDDDLLISFRIYGDIEKIAWHDASREGGADELWKHSCFEAFVGCAGTGGYVEVNLAPAKQWALYAFDGYRTGMRHVDDASVHRVDFVPRHRSVPRLEMHVALQLPAPFRRRQWRAGFSVIIEETDGTKSYWALAHAPGPPDFHNPDCFIATLPALDRS